MNTSPQTEMALEVGNLPVDSLWGCGSLVSPSRPLLSPSFQFSLVPRDTMLESSNISYDTNLHTLQLSTYAHASGQRMTHCSPRPGTAVLNVFLITSKQEEVRTLLFFSDKFWCQKLTLNSSSVSNTLPLSKDLHYLLPPSPTDLCFLFFISSLYPLSLSSIIPSCFLFLDLP